MLIRNRRAINRAVKKHAQARKPIGEWIELAELGEWGSIVDARQTFPTADLIRGTNLTCFNIGGNNFRLRAIVSYRIQEIGIVELLTHAEYDKKYT